MPAPHTAVYGQPRVSTCPRRNNSKAMSHARPVAAAASADDDDGGRRHWAFSTRLLHPRKVFTDPYAAISPPLYQVSAELVKRRKGRTRFLFV
jgi:hypothetical protein